MYRNYKMEDLEAATSRLMIMGSDTETRSDDVYSTTSTSSLVTVESYSGMNDSGLLKDEDSMSPRSVNSNNVSLSDYDGSESGSCSEHVQSRRLDLPSFPQVKAVDHCYTNRNSPQTQQAQAKEQHQIIKYGHLSNEHVRLTEVLDNLHPEQVVDVIRRQLDKRDSKIIVAMSVLFPRAQFPPLEKTHCVRCHVTYNPYDDANCLIRHPSNAVVKVTQDREGSEFVCKLCRHRFKLKSTSFYDDSVSFYMSGFCYKGKHTNLADEVLYGGPVRTCQENGCVEVFL